MGHHHSQGRWLLAVAHMESMKWLRRCAMQEPLESNLKPRAISNPYHRYLSSRPFCLDRRATRSKCSSLASVLHEKISGDEAQLGFGALSFWPVV